MNTYLQFEEYPEVWTNCRGPDLQWHAAPMDCNTRLHPHHELIAEHESGHLIESSRDGIRWVYEALPAWSPSWHYRVATKLHTPQMVFDKVARHLLKQMRVSRNSMGRCVYRSGLGLKCAVGCLISDGHYSAKLEGWCAQSSLVQQALRLSGVCKFNNLMFDLQRLHDTCDPSSWRTELYIVAGTHNLNQKVIR